jgi:hypothetical protein
MKKTWWQECRQLLTLSLWRASRMDASAGLHPPLFFQSRPLGHGMALPMFRVCPLSSKTFLYQYPHGHLQISNMILNPIKLALSNHIAQSNDKAPIFNLLIRSMSLRAITYNVNSKNCQQLNFSHVLTSCAPSEKCSS